MNKVIALLFSIITTSAAAEDLIPAPRGDYQAAEPVYEGCQSTREFITTLEYLRDQKQLGLDERECRAVALEVSKGCTGAAKRFSWSFEIILKTDAGTRSALKIAQDLAQKSNAYTEAFVGIFTHSYLSEYLDLDYNTALSIAKSLSTDYVGDPKIALSDFLELTEFCTQDKSIGLSKPRCGVIAGRIVKNAENFKMSMAKDFKRLFKFTSQDPEGPVAPLLQALKICESIISISPEAPDNFMQAFKYAVNDKGLNYSAKQSVDFASKIASHTKFDPARLPAALRESAPTPAAP